MTGPRESIPNGEGRQAYLEPRFQKVRVLLVAWEAASRRPALKTLRDLCLSRVDDAQLRRTRLERPGPHPERRERPSQFFDPLCVLAA